MELRHLRYFVAVAQEENVTHAARKLYVSQPCLSSQIHDLEAEIGFALFERKPRSMQLSVAGRIFLGEAQAILARTALAVERARAGLTPPTEIHVGYAPSGTTEILPRALRVFQRSSPGVRVTLHDLSVEEMLPLLLQRKLDVALTLPPRPKPREFGMKEVERYEMCVAVGPAHPLAASPFVRLDQVAAGPVATYSRKDYPGYHKRLKEMFATVGRKPRLGSEHDGVTSLMAAVAADQEFALVPSCAVSLTGPQIKLLKLRPALPPMSIVALWRKDAETESVKAFIAATLPRQEKGDRNVRRHSVGKPTDRVGK